jgi:hypothetical protein
MSKNSGSKLRFLLCWMGLLSALAAIQPAGGADNCPTAGDEIATDRPDVTNSSRVVPFGSLQAENGVDWTAGHGFAVHHQFDAIDGTNTRLRLGIAQCTEFLVDAPNYWRALNSSQPTGFSDVVVSFKRQLPAPLGFDLSATAGAGFPTGSTRISGHGYEPYIQFPWSHEIADGWGLAGMFTLFWFPSEPRQDPTFEPTLSLERALGPSADLFIEYVGDYSHERPSQVLDTGGAWRFTRTQQIDFHAGFGLNSSSVDHYFGVGYSLRLDGLFGGTNSP